MKKRVVVTGIGILSPVGIGVEASWDAIINGRSGIGPITRFDASDMKTKIAGEVSDFAAEDWVSKKDVKRFDLFIHMAVATARIAMEHAKLESTPETAEDFGVAMGCGLGGLASIEFHHKNLLEKGASRMSPFFIPMVISNMAPGKVAIDFNFKGPNLLFSTACAAGTHAIGDSYRIIQNGVAKVMLCGGVEAVITALGISGFNALRATSTRNDEPEKASRPFERDRNGFVMGEGGGLLVLEELDHALERGANILAEVGGFGMSCDAFHITAPAHGGTGAVQCMRNAIEDAGLTIDDVDYINAHGTSTELNDAFETQAIKTLFGKRAYDIPISSTKSMVGHLLGAAGGVEAALSVLALQHGILPPTINYDNPDPECDLDYVPNQARKVPIKTAMSNSFGFGGTNGTLLFKAYSP